MYFVLSAVCHIEDVRDWHWPISIPEPRSSLGIMADKVKSIDEVISTANSLRATVSKVFQDLATNPSVNKETGDSSETSMGGNIIQTLKKNLTSVHKVLR